MKKHLSRRRLVINVSIGLVISLIPVMDLWALPASTDIRVKDDTHMELVIAEPAHSVVSLAPHITELVFAISAGNKLVGTVNHSDYPKEALSIPRVGSYKKVSYETIAALQPDLILAFGSGNGWEMINHLRSLGFKVYVDEPGELEDLAKTLKKLGLLLGQPDQGEQQAQEFLQRHNALKVRYQHKETVEVFYQVWNKPLITISNKHIISDVIRLCGGKNIFDDAIPLAPKISLEMVIRRNPEVILASGMGEARPKWLDDWRSFTSIRAVKNGQLYFIPPDLLQRHTPRILNGAEMMCRYLDQVRRLRKPNHRNT